MLPAGKFGRAFVYIYGIEEGIKIHETVLWNTGGFLPKWQGGLFIAFREVGDTTLMIKLINDSRLLMTAVRKDYERDNSRVCYFFFNYTIVILLSHESLYYFN